MSDQAADLQTLDQATVAILADLAHAAIGSAHEATEQVLSLSSEFIGARNHTVLKQFYQLYFGLQPLEDKKGSVNSEVDDLFDNLSAAHQRGEDLTAVNEDETAKTERLGLAGVQKQLEGLITLQEGIKEKLIPVLSGMQFEDMMRHRLLHITEIWRKWNEVMGSADGSANTGTLAVEMAQMMTSQAEAETYYREVLDSEPPEGLPERSTFIEL